MIATEIRCDFAGCTTTADVQYTPGIGLYIPDDLINGGWVHLAWGYEPGFDAANYPDHHWGGDYCPDHCPWELDARYINAQPVDPALTAILEGAPPASAYETEVQDEGAQ